MHEGGRGAGEQDHRTDGRKKRRRASTPRSPRHRPGLAQTKLNAPPTTTTIHGKGAASAGNPALQECYHLTSKLSRLYSFLLSYGHKKATFSNLLGRRTTEERTDEQSTLPDWPTTDWKEHFRRMSPSHASEPASNWPDRALALTTEIAKVEKENGHEIPNFTKNPNLTSTKTRSAVRTTS